MLHQHQTRTASGSSAAYGPALASGAIRVSETHVSQQARQNRMWPIVSLAAAGCLWGTGLLFCKIAFVEMTVSENVGYRFIFGSLGLSPILWKSPPKFHRRACGLLVLASIVGVPIQVLLQFKGLEATTVSHASLIVGTLPVLLALS